MTAHISEQIDLLIEEDKAMMHAISATRFKEV